MSALGLVETRGLIGAIEAADTMLKAADVRLLEKTLATGGLVTITIAGEVSAVQSAVDAAAASLERFSGEVCVSRHVIPRPDAELEVLVRLSPQEDEAPESAVPDPGASPPPCGADPGAGGGPGAEADGAPPHDASGYSREACRSMSIRQLRQLAASLKVPRLTPEQIATANKNTLLSAIERAARKEKG